MEGVGLNMFEGSEHTRLLVVQSVVGVGLKELQFL